MKIHKNKGNDLFYKAMGEIDPQILNEIEEIERNEEKPMKKKMNLVAMVACCILLIGAGNGLVRELTGGGIFEWKNSEKTGFSFSGEEISHKIYEEREDGLYYIFEGEHINITEYCSDTDYFVAPVLDENGTGYITVIGGKKGERGFILNHFEHKEFFIGQTENEILEYPSIEMIQPDKLFNHVNSALPQIIWNHHATHFIGHTLSEEWIESPETIENNYGSATKIGDNFYYVQGIEIGVYTPREQLNYITEELFLQVDWITSVGGEHPALLNQEGDIIKVNIYDEWTQDRELEVIEILDKIGFPYTLEFIE